MSNQEWLKLLKAGDKVHVSGQYGRCGEIRRVIRVTAASVFIEGRKSATGEKTELRFNARHGRAVGCPYSVDTPYIREATPEIEHECYVSWLKNKLQVLRDTTALPDDANWLHRCIALFEEAKGGAK